jgi:purine nucleosidase
MSAERRRVIVDTDTAGDDTQAILLSLLSDRAAVEGLTMVAGNVEFEYEVENAKYTLQLAGREDVPVYEGAEEPLLKDHEYADYVHGAGGLGGDLFPDTGIESADEHAVEFILDTVRESPGEVSLLCIGPLTNIALALKREPDLNEVVDEVWIMGGAVNCLGNVIPSAEYNFWVDPDAAKLVLRELDCHLVDWGLTVETGTFRPAEYDRIADADTPYADFFREITEPVREFTQDEQGIDGVTQPDSLAAALLYYPELRGESGTYYADVDEREGMTRGHSAVDETGMLDAEARTTVWHSADADGYRDVMVSMLREGDPDAGR